MKTTTIQIIGFSAIVLTLALGIVAVNATIDHNANKLKESLENLPSTWLKDILDGMEGYR